MNRLLVTGAARSGTTILGRVLDFAPQTNYLLEPFNRYVWMQCPDYHAYLGENSPELKKGYYREFISNVLDMRGLVPWPDYKKDSYLKNLASGLGLRRITLTTNLAKLYQKILSPESIVYKDPSACFLSGYLLREYGFKVIYTVRHPAALYTARKELNWIFDPRCFELQPDLVESFGSLWDKLYPLKGGGVLEQSIILWMCIYSTLYRLEREHPERVFRLRHEDWCEDPIVRIREVYDNLGLVWSKSVENKISKITSGKNDSRRVSSLATMEARDSKALIYKWKNKVTTLELDLIQEYCGDLLNILYPEASFKTL